MNIGRVLLTMSFLYSGFVFAAATCTTDSSVLNCGGVQVMDPGCKTQCEANHGYEPICTKAECHSIENHWVDEICKTPGANCLIGADMKVYTIGHSACFCD